MCGFWKRKLIKGNIGLVSKYLVKAADAFTGGLASNAVNATIKGLNEHAGLIGDLLQKFGTKKFTPNTRNKLSNFVDKALLYIPKSDVRTALEKINNVAQGRPEDFNIKTKFKKKPKLSLSNVFTPQDDNIKPHTKTIEVTGPSVSEKGRFRIITASKKTSTTASTPSLRPSPIPNNLVISG